MYVFFTYLTIQALVLYKVCIYFETLLKKTCKGVKNKL